MSKLRAMILMLMLGLLPQNAVAGKVGGTMARYSLAGAGIGALLGAASATIPYLSDHQSFDFSVGAGAGAAGGAVCGLIFGIVDLATDQGTEAEASRPRQRDGLFAFNAGPATYLAWKMTF